MWMEKAVLPVVGLAILTTGVAVTHVGSAVGGPVPIAGGTFEASGVAHVPGTTQFLFVDDDRPAEVFVIEVTPEGKQRGGAVSVPIAVRVTDPEGMTWDGRHFYVVGSQSKLTGTDGDGLVRFLYDPATRRVDRVESIRDLKGWLASHVPELRGIDRKVGDHVLNIEGLAWDPIGRRLLLGLRAPVIDNHALIVPLALPPAGERFTRETIRLAGETIRLPLGGAGIRSIEFDEVSRHFRLVTGATLNDESLDFHVVAWDGEEDVRFDAAQRFDRHLKPEGLVTAFDEAGAMTVLVFDTSRILIAR